MNNNIKDINQIDGSSVDSSNLEHGVKHVNRKAVAVSLLTFLRDSMPGVQTKPLWIIMLTTDKHEEQ